MNAAPYTLNPSKVLTVDEVSQLCAAYDHPRNGNERLTRILILLGCNTGLRASELCALRIDEVHLDRLVLYVRNGKGRRARAVKFPQTLAHALRRWIDEERPPSDAPNLLISWRPSGQPLSRAGLWYRFRVALEHTPIPEERRKHLSLHSMRHYFATRSLELGKSLPWVQHQLGHASIHTTSGYLGIANLAENGAAELTTFA